LAQLDSPLILEQSDPLTIEAALFIDQELITHFATEFGGAKSEQELHDFALSLINHVYVLYQQPTMTTPIDLVLVRFEMWKQQPVRARTCVRTRLCRSKCARPCTRVAKRNCC
jgi:hypothetical protein